MKRVIICVMSLAGVGILGAMLWRRRAESKDDVADADELN